MLSAETHWGNRDSRLAESYDRFLSNRFRYYDPGIGRYVSADPIGQMGGSNVFLYALNNPANAIDPLGLQTTDFPGGLDDPEVERILRQNGVQPDGGSPDSASPDPPQPDSVGRPVVPVPDPIDAQDKLKKVIGPTAVTCNDDRLLCLDQAVGTAQCQPGQAPPTQQQCTAQYLKCLRKAAKKATRGGS